MKNGVPSGVATKIRAEGVFVRGSALSIKFIPGDETRFAPVVSKRQGNAVQRNRVKRVVRHLFAEVADSVPDGSYLLYIHNNGGCVLWFV